MSTQPTNQPVPSESAHDLKFNAGKFDEFVTSESHVYVDRFGDEHRTIAGINFSANQAMLNYGYITKKSFEVGATLDTPNTVLQWESDGEFYRWDGDWSQPKVVPPGSTPDTTGGIGPGKWVGVGDASLRSELSEAGGAELVGVNGPDGSEMTVQDAINATATSYYSQKNRQLLGDANKKLYAGEALTIVCLGDSMTVGHDTTSPDVIPGINGDTNTIAPIQYPGRLQDRLNLFTSSTVTVLNHGFSGDTAKSVYDRWTTNPGANVAHLMVGINDSNGGRGATFSEFKQYYEMLIRRYINWGCGVVVHTCTAQYNNNTNPPASAFSQYARSIAEQYGCPVFESESVLQYNLPGDVYSDGIHFNKSGYAKYGDAVASFVMAGGWLGQFRKVSSYTSTQSGRSTEGIGFFSKNVTLSSSDNSYVFNKSLARISDNSILSFSFFLDSDFADIHLVGSFIAGMSVNISSPMANAAGVTPYNIMPLKKEYNKNISETASYTVADRSQSFGGKSYAGSLVGRGWKTVYLQNTGVAAGVSYLNYLIIEPSAPHMQNQVADAGYHGMSMHSAVDEVMIYKKPYYARNTGASTTPAATPLGTVAVPLPSALLGYVAVGTYADSNTVRVTIKISNSANTSTVSNGITELILHRQDGTNTVTFDVVYKSNANSAVPTSVRVTSENFDGSSPNNSYPVGVRNGYLVFEFNSTVAVWASIEVRGARMTNADQSWLC